MRRFTLLAATLLLSFWAFTPALANFDAKMAVTCYEVDEGDASKLVKDKVVNEEIVRACLEIKMLASTDADVALHALVFDSDTFPAGELRVIRRCDSAVICTLSVAGAVQTASKVSSTTEANRSVAFYDLSEVASGSMVCGLSDSFKASSGAFKFKAACTGILEADGVPCQMKLKSGKLFEEEPGPGCL